MVMQTDIIHDFVIHTEQISVSALPQKRILENNFLKGLKSKDLTFIRFMHFTGGKYLKSFALGDYQIQLGQGLNLWSSYAFGKSSGYINDEKKSDST